MPSYQAHGHPIIHGLPAGSTLSIFSEIKMKRRQLLFKQNCSLLEILASSHSITANYLYELSILTEIDRMAFSNAHLLSWPGDIWLLMYVKSLKYSGIYSEKNRGVL